MQCANIVISSPVRLLISKGLLQWKETNSNRGGYKGGEGAMPNSGALRERQRGEGDHIAL